MYQVPWLIKILVEIKVIQFNFDFKLLNPSQEILSLNFKLFSMN
jgi:hypothetical protein